MFRVSIHRLSQNSSSDERTTGVVTGRRVGFVWPFDQSMGGGIAETDQVVDRILHNEIVTILSTHGRLSHAAQADQGSAQ